jgi:hypothetical protein
MLRSNQNSRHLQRTVKPSKRSRPDRHWTLLFIGDHGRVITLKRFKGLMLLGVLALSISIALALGFYFFSHDIIAEKKQLETELKNIEKQLKVLRHEKDVLMTRLVLAESRVQDTLSDRTDDQAVETSAQQVVVAFKENAAPTVVAENEPAPATPAPHPSETEPVIAQPEPQLSVVIEGFQSAYSARDNSIQVQFKVKNTSPNSQYVAGYTVVVLKGPQIEPRNWIAIPRVPLAEGKPAGRNRGYSFGINHFMTVRLKTAAPKSLDKFQTATVFVFTRSGELLLEQDFPASLHSNDADAAAAPPLSTDDTGQAAGEFSAW